MKTKYFYIVQAIWIFMVVVSSGLAESFDGRPTETNMDDLMALGIKTGHGVYERCYATQYSTNPAYYVSPPSFIGTNGWYLSTSVMQTLDEKAKALVPYYANTNTVYDGTTNIIMFSVTGLWAQLVIGDITNQFTGTPAIGTNPPTYGDYPWWIYSESLEERYKVLNALKYTIGISPSVTVLFTRGKRGWNTGTWGGDTNGFDHAKSVAESNFNASTVTTNIAWEYRTHGIGHRAVLGVAKISSNYPDWKGYYADITSSEMCYSNAFYPPLSTNPSGNNKSFVFVNGNINANISGAVQNTNTWDANDSGLPNPNEWLLVNSESLQAGENPISSVDWFGSLTMPNWGDYPNDPPYAPDGFSYSTSCKVNGWEKSWSYGQSFSFLTIAFTEWNFQYCTDE